MCEPIHINKLCKGHFETTEYKDNKMKDEDISCNNLIMSNVSSAKYRHILKNSSMRGGKSRF